MYTLSDVGYTKEKLLEELLTDLGPGMLKRYHDAAAKFTKKCNSTGHFHVEKDIHKIAIRFYQRSAEYDDVKAQEILARYYNGDSQFPTDYSIVMQYSLEAAKHGSQIAYLTIAELFKNGNGVAINKQIAMEWYFKTENFKEKGEELLKSSDLSYSEKEKNKLNTDLLEETKELVLVEQVRNFDSETNTSPKHDPIYLSDKNHQLRQSLQHLEDLLEKNNDKEVLIEEQNSIIRMEFIQEQLQNHQSTNELNRRNKVLKKKIKDYQRILQSKGDGNLVDAGSSKVAQHINNTGDSEQDNDLNYDSE